MTVRTLAIGVAALVAGLWTVSLPAQSFSSGAGLGLPVDGLDARARALGGVTTGLFGNDLSVYNPAGSATLEAATLRVAFQPEWRTTHFEAGGETASTMRIPLFQAGFRFGERWSASLSYAGVFDQRWAVVRDDSAVVGDERLAVRDLYQSDGGISRFVASGAFEVTEALALGAGLQLYTGGSTREIRREFERGFDLAQSIGEWRFRGTGVTLGARWSPGAALVAAAAMDLGGTLEGRPVTTDGVVTPSRSYDLPIALRGGGSGRITQELAATVSADWAGWAAANEDFGGGHESRDSWTVAGGIEWEPIAEGVIFPVRVGGRVAALPFRTTGGDWLSERALSAGVGARLGQGAVHASAAIERGWRTGAEALADEDFWRMSLSLTVLGR